MLQPYLDNFRGEGASGSTGTGILNISQVVESYYPLIDTFYYTQAALLLDIDPGLILY